MCALSGSYSLDKLKELYELNSYRGVVSSSFAIFDEDADLVVVQRYSGRIPEEIWTDERMTVENHGCYFLCHSQAPTSSDSNPTIHPAEYSKYFSWPQHDDPEHELPYTCLLWHNGIIKPTSIDALNQKLNSNHKWDTALLAQLFADHRTVAVGSELSEVNGSFACVLHTYLSNVASLYVLRNEISPLFTDSDLNISSTKFENSTPLEAGEIFELDVMKRRLIPTGIKFKTAENPYYFA